MVPINVCFLQNAFKLCLKVGFSNGFSNGQPTLRKYCVYVCVCVCVHIYECLYVCICVHKSIWIYIDIYIKNETKSKSNYHTNLTRSEVIDVPERLSTSRADLAGSSESLCIAQSNDMPGYRFHERSRSRRLCCHCETDKRTFSCYYTLINRNKELNVWFTAH